MTTAVGVLNSHATAIGLGEIYYGLTVALNYNVGGWEPGQDPRSPDIIVTPNAGMTYSNSTSMIGDHGGFGHDDTNVILRVAPTIVEALGLNPAALDAVRAEGTSVLCPKLRRSWQSSC
jgi:hypothetical protein